MRLLIFYLTGLISSLTCPLPRDGAREELYAADSKCVYIYDDTHLNWADAEKECQQIRMGELGGHGDLVTVHDAIFDKWLYEVLTVNDNYFQSYWIGLRAVCPTCPLDWVDSHPFDYTNWQTGRPSGEGIENCVESHTADTTSEWYNDGLWNDNSCKSEMLFICQFYPEGDPWSYTKDWPLGGGCSKGWYQFAGACYIIPVSGNGLSDLSQLKAYDMAETKCQEFGSDSHLAIITNRYQMAFISAMMYQQNLQSRPFIGVQSAQNDHYFHYVDQDRLVFSNWAPKNPRLSDETSRCTVMDWHPADRDERIGLWTDVECGTPRPWVCTQQVDVSAQPEPLPNNNVECPEDWIAYGYFCYKFVFQAKSHTEAETDCAGMTSLFPDGKVTLSSILHDYENEFILSFFGSDYTGRTPPSHLWIGLSAGPSADREITWSDEHHFDFSNWGEHQPGAIETQTKGAMDKDGFWYLMNESQSGKMPYVCKANLNYRKEQEWHEQRGELLNCSTTHHGHSHDSDWHAYKEYCIRAFSDEASWSQAELNCEKQEYPANLVSIHDNDMNVYVYTLLHKVSKSEGWIGMRNIETRGWKWTDESSTSFTSWSAGEPSFGGISLGTEDCVEMNQAGNWNNIDCNRKEMPYVCSHARQWSNCVLADIEKKSCGFAGISQGECMDTFKCCFDPNSEMPCFLPAGSSYDPNAPDSSGMSNAGAATLMAFFCLLLPVGFFALSKVMPTNVFSSFSNPSQSV